MTLQVKPEDIARFDSLYHTLMRNNLNSEFHYPKELKSLTKIDIAVINAVAINPSIIIREIAEELEIPNSTLTSSINRLEKKGMAKRQISARDRRSFSIELTERGWGVQKIHLDFEKTCFEGILKRLPTHEDRKACLDLIEKIVNADPHDANR